MPYFESLDGAIVSFLNYGNGLAIDLKLSGGAERGTPIFGFQFHGHGNQQWKLERVKDGSVWPVYMIRNVQFGTCIDLSENTNGARVKGWPGNDTSNKHQLWRLVTADAKGRIFMIQNIGTNTYLDLRGGGTEPRTPIQGYAGPANHTNKNQMWRILRMD